MNYSNNPSHCRVDFWKDTGKWYATEEIVFEDRDYDGDIHKAFKRALLKKLRKSDGSMSYSGMRATCLEPCHKHAHPISLVIPEQTSEWSLAL